MVKNLPANATDAGDVGSQSIGSDATECVRVRVCAHTHTHTHTHTLMVVPRLFASKSSPCQYSFQSQFHKGVDQR